MNESEHTTNLCFQKVWFVKAVFHKLFKNHMSVCVSRLAFQCILVAKKENLTVFLTGLTPQSKNLDPTGDPTGFHLCRKYNEDLISFYHGLVQTFIALMHLILNA